MRRRTAVARLWRLPVGLPSRQVAFGAGAERKAETKQCGKDGDRAGCAPVRNDRDAECEI